MIGGFSGAAYAAAIASVAIAAVMLVVLLWVVVRRFQAEKRVTERLAQEREIARALLTAISNDDAGAGAWLLRDIPEDAQIAATTHLFQLLRGDDRDRLIAIAEASGVFSSAMADLESRNVSRRVDAIRMLERFGTDASVDGLTARLAVDPSPVVRIEAAATLARLGKLPTAPRVIQMLALKHVALTRQHLALLRAMAPQHGAEMRRLLDEQLPVALRCAIVEALGWSEDFSLLPDIAQFAVDPDALLRCAALRAAGQLGHPAARGWAVDALDDDDSHVRAEAIVACGQLGLSTAITRIMTMRHDADWNVRVQARRLTERPAFRQNTAPPAAL